MNIKQLAFLIFNLKQAQKNQGQFQDQMFAAESQQFPTSPLATMADDIIPKLRKRGGWEIFNSSIKKTPRK